MKSYARWIAVTFVGMLMLLGALYFFTQENAGQVPFFYTTR